MGEDRTSSLCSPLVCEAQLGCFLRKCRWWCSASSELSAWHGWCPAGTQVWGAGGPAYSLPGDPGHSPTCRKHRLLGWGPQRRITCHVALRAGHPSVCSSAASSEFCPGCTVHFLSPLNFTHPASSTVNVLIPPYQPLGSSLAPSPLSLQVPGNSKGLLDLPCFPVELLCGVGSNSP